MGTARALGLVAAIGVLLGCGARSGLIDAPSLPASASPDASGAADAPPPDITVDLGLPDTLQPDAGPGARQQVVEACAYTAACTASSGHPVTLSQCLEWFARKGWLDGSYETMGAQLLDRLRSCAPAASCQALYSCYGGTWIGPTTCRAGASCEKGRVQSGAEHLDCAVLGRSCVELPPVTAGERACCALKTCPTEPAASTTCLAGDPTRGVHCKAGIAEEIDCGAWGMVCNPSALPCKGTGAWCMTKSGTSCGSFTVAQFCMPSYGGGDHGYNATVDCSQNPVHGKCNGGGSTFEPCAPAGNECWTDLAAECQGTRLMVCVDGYKLAVDCEAIGFDLCGTPPPDSTPRCMYAL